MSSGSAGGCPYGSTFGPESLLRKGVQYEVAADTLLKLTLDPMLECDLLWSQQVGHETEDDPRTREW